MASPISLRVALFGAASLLASPAFAQSIAASGAAASGAVATSGTLEEVIVTARDRAESLQSVPLSITAVSGNTLESMHATNITDLKTLAPSFNLIRNTSNPSSVFLYLRGFGTKVSDPSAEPAIAITIDGIYQPYIIGNMINLFDVDRVEVLRGPQNILLGKNAPAGGIAIYSRRPADQFGAKAQFDYGSFNDFQFHGSVDVPVVPGVLATRLSYYKETSDSYIYNTNLHRHTSGLDAQSVRLGVLFKPTDYVTWYVKTGYDLDQGRPVPERNISDFTPLAIPGVHYVTPPLPTTTCRNAYSAALCAPGGGLPNLAHYTTDESLLPKAHDTMFLVTSDLNIDAGPVSITSLTGYRSFHERQYADIDGTHLGILDTHFMGTYHSLSQELRLSSRDHGGLDMDGKLKWVAGLYYLNNSHYRIVDQIALGANASSEQDVHADSYALFAQAEYQVTPRLSVTGGVRETWDVKTHHSSGAKACGLTGFSACPVGGGFEANQKAEWSNFSLEAGAQYKFSDDTMVYARFAQGYRGGGFTGVPSSALLAVTFNPETVDAYEIGAKVDLLEHTLRLNGSLFRNEYSNLQRTISVPISTAPFQIQLPRNIASAVTQGVELEALFRPTHALTLHATVGYLDAHYTDFFADLTGGLAPPQQNTDLKFPLTSKFTGSIGAKYDVDLHSMGSLTFAADYNYRSKLNFSDLSYPQFSQDGYGLLNASVGWRDPSRKYYVTVYAKNLTDKYYLEAGDQVGGLTSYAVDGAPRSFGVSVGAEF